jgi:hypothetical protein
MKNKEREIGLKVNELVNEFHKEMRHIKKKGLDDETKQYVDNLMKELVELRQTPRFVKDFPSFSSFFAYVRIEKLKKSDLEALENE